MSQEDTKTQAVTFFGNQIEHINKKLIYIKLQDFHKEHNKIKIKVQRNIQKSQEDRDQDARIVASDLFG